MCLLVCLFSFWHEWTRALSSLLGRNTPTNHIHAFVTGARQPPPDPRWLLPGLQNVQEQDGVSELPINRVVTGIIAASLRPIKRPRFENVRVSVWRRVEL